MKKPYGILTEHMKRKWLKELDYIRALAILAVVAIHTTGSWELVRPLTKTALFALVINELSVFAVPFFFLVSGIVLFSSYESSSIINFYKKRLRSILLPYLFFSIIYEIFKSVYFNTHLTSNRFVSDIALARSYYHFWFFLVLIYYYLLYPFLCKFYLVIRKNRNLNISVCILFFFLPLIWKRFEIANNLQKFGSEYLITEFFRYLIFIYLGIIIYNNYHSYINIVNRRNIIWLLLISLSAVLLIIYPVYLSVNHEFDFLRIEQYYRIYSAVFLPAYVLPLFLISLSVFYHMLGRINPVKKLFKIIGDFSLGIYMIHMLYNILIYNEFLKKIGLNERMFLTYPLLFCVSVTLSTITIWMMSQTTFGSFLLGNRVINEKKIQ